MEEAVQPGPLFTPAAFEPHCHYLVVRNGRDRVIATLRVLPPQGALRLGGYAAESAFDLQMLDVLRHRMLELGRPRVHPEYEAVAVMPALGDAIARYLIKNGHDYVFAAIPVDLSDGGHAAAALYQDAVTRAESPDDLRVFPRYRFPLEAYRATEARPPAVLRGLMDLGAWVCGEPAWIDSENCAEIPVLLPLARMHSRETKLFLARAA